MNFRSSSIVIITTWLACLSAAESRAGQFTVVLDAGHSPESPGAISARGVPEVDFNDRLTAAIAKELKKDPRFRVEITRAPKTNLPLKKRARLIKSLDPDLVLSIHHDSVQPHFLKTWKHKDKKLSYSDRFNGFSLFVPRKGYYAALSKRAATLMADGLREIGLGFASYHAQPIPGESRKWLDSKRGIYAGDFLYLARTIQRPFVLFEAGVLVNRAEEKRLSDPKQIEKMTSALVKSIRDLAYQFERDRRVLNPIAPQVNDLAIRFPKAIPVSPVIRFTKVMPGLEFALTPIYFHDQFVDRLVLVRADPKLFRLGVFFDKKMKSITDWRKELGAAVVINASFFGHDPVGPTTPIVSNGKLLGPKKYRSSHGAMLAEPEKPGLETFVLRDYDDEPVKLGSAGYRQAVASYPMLIDGKGRTRASENPKWRADRSFVARDKQGRMVFGTSEGGFFSLYRLGRFLKLTPDLDLSRALNLDGGPPACLSIKAGKIEYLAVGQYASNDASGTEKILSGRIEIIWPIPGVIALFPRKK